MPGQELALLGDTRHSLSPMGASASSQGRQGPPHAGCGSGMSVGTDFVLSFVPPAPPHSCCTLPVQTSATLVLPSSFSLKEKSLQDLSSLSLTETLLALGMSVPSPGSDGAFDVSV